jgi:hypothetical protein
VRTSSAYAREGFAGLRLLADITGWWDTSSSALPPQGLGEIAADHPELRPSLRSAACLRTSRRRPGSPAWPAAGPTQPQEHLAARVADPASSRDPDQVAADRWLVDALLMPKAGARGFIKRQLTIRPGVSFASHIARLLGRFGVARWRIRGTRTLTPVATGPSVDDTRSAAARIRR